MIRVSRDPTRQRQTKRPQQYNTYSNGVNMVAMAWEPTRIRYRNQRGTAKSKDGTNKSQKTLDLLEDLQTLLSELTPLEFQKELRLRAITWLPSRAAIALCLKAQWQWQRVEILIVDHGRQSSARYPTYSKIGEALAISKQRAQELVDDLVKRHKHATYKGGEYCLNVDQWIRILQDLSELDEQLSGS
jgi:hypothetical protein